MIPASSLDKNVGQITRSQSQKIGQILKVTRSQSQKVGQILKVS